MKISVARPWALARAANPAGGLISCVPDLLRYARLLIGQGPPGFLSRASLRLMQSPLAAAGNFADSVGVAWMLRTIDRTTIVEHSGGTLGQQTVAASGARARLRGSRADQRQPRRRAARVAERGADAQASGPGRAGSNADRRVERAAGRVRRCTTRRGMASIEVSVDGDGAAW